MTFTPSTFSRFSARQLFSGSSAASLPLTIFLGLALSTSAGAQSQQQAQQQVLPLPLNEVRMFTEALDRIRMSYVEEIDDQTLLENAIRGMLAGLDPHSCLLYTSPSPRDAHESRMPSSA